MSQLVALTKQVDVLSKLPLLEELATELATRRRPWEKYEAADSEFIDGFELRLGHITRAEAQRDRELLLSGVNSALHDLLIQGCLFQQRDGYSAIWFTLTPEKAIITPYTMSDLANAVDAVRQHASFIWGYTEEELTGIKIGKLSQSLSPGW